MMSTLIGAPTAGEYPLTASIDTANVFSPTSTTVVNVDVTHLGPAVSTLSDDPGTGPHHIIGDTGTLQSGNHTYEFAFDDGCQSYVL